MYSREVNGRYLNVWRTESEESLSPRIASSETRTRRALILFAGFAAFVLSINVYQGDVREVALWIGVIVVQLCYLAPGKFGEQTRALRCCRLCVTAALPFGMSDWGMFVIVAGIMAALLLPIELRHATLRRKLPVEEWPTGLFN